MVAAFFPGTCTATSRSVLVGEAAMNKTSELFPHWPAEPLHPDRAFGKAYSDARLYLKDQRVSQLVVLLQQVQESAGGLGALPQPQLNEIVASAVRLCGFANPILAEDVIATVLEAFEMRDSIPGSP
jgi:hypothetical protein